MYKKLLRTILCVIAVALLASGPAWADSFNVFVGYADNLRASGFFPTPWLGAPGVVSQTPSPNSIVFDSGAVRIDNTGATSIAISNFQVMFNSIAGTPTTIAIWGSGTQLTIAPGQTGIFTQITGSQNFDSSDFGAFDAFPPANLEPNNADLNGNTNLIGGCSSPSSFFTGSEVTTCSAANAPIITFDENGNPVSFSDTGFILDTGEWDFVNNGAFGEDGNESINWNTIGGTSRGGTAPEPSSIVLLGVAVLGVAAFARKRRSEA